MREITTKIFKYNELTEKARDRARQDYARDYGFTSEGEAFASLQALTEKFGGKITNYEIDYFNCFHSTIAFDTPEMTGIQIATILSELGDFNPETLKGLGDCKLTGVCHDEDAIDGFRQAFHDGERDLEKLMQAAFRAWLKAAQSECEAFYSDDEFAEHAEANEFEFYEDGRAF